MTRIERLLAAAIVVLFLAALAVALFKGSGGRLDASRPSPSPTATSVVSESPSPVETHSPEAPVPSPTPTRRPMEHTNSDKVLAPTGVGISFLGVVLLVLAAAGARALARA